MGITPLLLLLFLVPLVYAAAEKKTNASLIESVQKNVVSPYGFSKPSEEYDEKFLISRIGDVTAEALKTDFYRLAALRKVEPNILLNTPINSIVKSLLNLLDAGNTKDILECVVSNVIDKFPDVLTDAREFFVGLLADLAETVEQKGDFCTHNEALRELLETQLGDVCPTKIDLTKIAKIDVIIATVRALIFEIDTFVDMEREEKLTFTAVLWFVSLIDKSQRADGKVILLYIRHALPKRILENSRPVLEAVQERINATGFVSEVHNLVEKYTEGKTVDSKTLSTMLKSFFDPSEVTTTTTTPVPAYNPHNNRHWNNHNGYYN